ncbi:MAG: glycoside hydrolase family 2 protein, partial [Candidatus Hydrogenedentota bacterium]
PDGESIHVPGALEQWAPGYQGAAWCFREFTLDASWLDRPVFVECDGAAPFAEVFLNGQPIGAHTGGLFPFAADASGALTKGANLLAVRVAGEEGHGALPAYFPFAGLCGVRLTAYPSLYLTGVFAQPDVRRRRLAVDVTASGEGAVRLEIEDADAQAEGSVGRIVLPFEGYTPWSPEEPARYALRCVLLDAEGNEADEERVSFGMREFNIKDQRFHLNGRPVYVKGIHWKPEYPVHLAAPPDSAMLREELTRAKEAGFNLIRTQGRPAPPTALALCDELGLMACEEPPLAHAGTPSDRRGACLRGLEGIVRRDRNHPSLVMWALGPARDTRAETWRLREELCQRVRELDPTRVLVDLPGGWATRSPARYFKPMSTAAEPFDAIEAFPRGPVDAHAFACLTDCGEPKQLAFVDAFGFGGLEDLAAVTARYAEAGASSPDATRLAAMLNAVKQGFDARSLDHLFGDLPGFAQATQAVQAAAIRRQLDAIRSNRKLDGYCLAQLNGAGVDVSAGILDRWRRPKAAHQGLNDLQAPMRPTIHMAHTTLYPRETADVHVTMGAALRDEPDAEVSVQVLSPTKQILWKKKRRVKLRGGERELWRGTVGASGAPGEHRLVARLMKGPRIIGESALEFHAFPSPEPSAHPIRLAEPHGAYTPAVTPLAAIQEEKALVHVVPPLANTIRAYPADELAAALAHVQDGGVTLIFEPPPDWNDFAASLDPALCATSRDAQGGLSGAFHYARAHPVFDGLPNQCLMGPAYVNTIPTRTFVEPTEEDICGCFDTRAALDPETAEDPEAWWGNNILVRSFGGGRVVFVNLRVMDHLGVDPTADRLFVNLLNHFARWSIPSQGTTAVYTLARNWLRDAAKNEVRRWLVAGWFPNWSGEGLAAVYPPERGIDPQGEYEGWHGPVRWKPWHSKLSVDHEIDLNEALSPVRGAFPDCGPGVAYAYAVFSAERRQSARVAFKTRDSAKVWLNGALLHEDEPFGASGDDLVSHEFEAFVRQGKNTVLVKIARTPGPSSFQLNFQSATRDPLRMTWWR